MSDYNKILKVNTINSYDHPKKYNIEKFLQELKKQERINKLKQCFGNDLKIE